MKYSPERVNELIDSVAWGGAERLRVFWIRLETEDRNDFSGRMQDIESNKNSHFECEKEYRIYVVLRQPLFSHANAVLSDVNRLITLNEHQFKEIPAGVFDRITIVILARDEFKLAQAASPIILPEWFPILAKRETNCRISDLARTAEEVPIKCEEIREGEICAGLYRIESEIVKILGGIAVANEAQLMPLMALLFPMAETQGQVVASEARIQKFTTHLMAVNEEHTYRPSSQKGHSFSGQLLRLISRSSPTELAKHAAIMANCIGDKSNDMLKPSIFAIMLRPSSKDAGVVKNWHAIMLSIYQAFQILNSAAHSHEYPSYSVSLLYNNSLDLRRFLSQALLYVESIGHE